MNLYNLKKIVIILNEIFLSLACKLKSPYLCAMSWKVSLFFTNFYNRSKLNKKILVLYRSYGINDLEKLKEDEKNEYSFLYFPRTNFKIIFNYFFSKVDHDLSDDKYFSEKKEINDAKKKYKIFIYETLKIFNKKKKFLAIISFNYRYRAEKELHAVCKPLNIKFIVFQKESLHYSDDSEITKSYIKTNSKNGSYKGDYLVVYTEGMKNVLISASIAEKNKIFVTGMPRADNYYKQFELLKKHILYLLPSWRPPLELEREFFLNQKYYGESVTKIILKFAENNPYEKIIIKTKLSKNNLVNLDDLINKKKIKNVLIKKGGDIESLIKDSKVVIGFQSSALIESIILKKPIIIPYFNLNKSEKFKKCILKLEEFSYYAYDENSMNNYLNDICINKIEFPKVDETKRKKIINHYIGNSDGKSASRLLDTLNKILI